MENDIVKLFNATLNVVEQNKTKSGEYKAENETHSRFLQSIICAVTLYGKVQEQHALAASFAKGGVNEKGKAYVTHIKYFVEKLDSDGKVAYEYGKNKESRTAFKEEFKVVYDSLGTDSVTLPEYAPRSVNEWLRKQLPKVTKELTTEELAIQAYLEQQALEGGETSEQFEQRCNMIPTAKAKAIVEGKEILERQAQEKLENDARYNRDETIRLFNLLPDSLKHEAFEAIQKAMPKLEIVAKKSNKHATGTN